MKLSGLALLAVIAVGGIVPAMAQDKVEVHRTVTTTTTRDGPAIHRDDPDARRGDPDMRSHRGHGHRKVCRTHWYHHRKVTRCTWRHW